jgi:predicted Zn-dependent protease with MMP-like domain
MLATASDQHLTPALTRAEMTRLKRRIRRLERTISHELSESQHHWLARLVANGRHGFALESLSRWFAESRFPIPDHIREEFSWLASSLAIESLVLPIVDARRELDLEIPEVIPVVAVGDDRIVDGCDVPIERFRQWVVEAVDALPAEFGRALHNVAIMVEEESEKRDVFGVYIGVPLTKKRYWQWYVHPDRIIIYRRTLCSHCRSEAEVRAQIYVTVVHEIGHHFGIGDERLGELGWQ